MHGFLCTPSRLVLDSIYIQCKLTAYTMLGGKGGKDVGRDILLYYTSSAINFKLTLVCNASSECRATLLLELVSALVWPESTLPWLESTLPLLESTLPCAVTTVKYFVLLPAFNFHAEDGSWHSVLAYGRGNILVTEFCSPIQNIVTKGG